MPTCLSVPASSNLILSFVFLPSSAYAVPTMQLPLLWLFYISSLPSVVFFQSFLFIFLITLQLVRKFIHGFNRKTQVNFLTNPVPPSTKICVKLLPDISFPYGEKFHWLPNSASYLAWPLRLLPSLPAPSGLLSPQPYTVAILCPKYIEDVLLPAFAAALFSI